MRLPPTRIKYYRGLLEDAGLYRPANDPLIETAVRLEVQIVKMENELSRKSMTLTQTGSCGQDKISIQPIVPELNKMYYTLSVTLGKLGLGNKTSQEVKAEAEANPMLDLLLDS